MGYYFDADQSGFHGLVWLDEGAELPDPVGNWHGPIGKFSDAKRQAKEYFQSDLETAREGLKRAREITSGAIHKITKEDFPSAKTRNKARIK